MPGETVQDLLLPAKPLFFQLECQTAIRDLDIFHTRCESAPKAFFHAEFLDKVEFVFSLRGEAISV